WQINQEVAAGKGREPQTIGISRLASLIRCWHASCVFLAPCVRTASLVADRLPFGPTSTHLPTAHPPAVDPSPAVSIKNTPLTSQEDFQRGKANGLSRRLPAAALGRRVEAGPRGP